MNEFSERNQEIKNLRFIKGLSLQSIGDKYGITRERVRQIIGNTGRQFRRKWTTELKSSGAVKPKHWTEIRDGKMPGLKRVWMDGWGDERHIAKSGNAKIIQKFEMRASSLLTGIDIEHKLMPYLYPFSILTANGIKIDVRVTHVDSSKLPSQTRCKYPTFAVPNLKSGKDCDYFIVFIPEGRGYTYFVIPSFEVYRMRYDARIRIPWPKLSNKISKWHKYHERIDLIN